MSFRGQVAIVTGASSGLGWSLARVLAEQGCRVGAIARRRDCLEKLAAEVRQAGGSIAHAVADVGSRAEITTAIHKLAAELGPVDLLIANAGVGFPTMLNPINDDEIETTIRVNLLGAIWSINAVLPDMLRRRQGQLAGISSMASYKGLPGESAYCASKAGLNSYLEALRIQLRSKGIAVTTVNPGFIRTPMTAGHDFHMPWLLDADIGARRIVRALERRAKVFDFPWQMKLLMKVTQWLPDWAIARGMRRYRKRVQMPDGQWRDVSSE